MNYCLQLKPHSDSDRDSVYSCKDTARFRSHVLNDVSYISGKTAPSVLVGVVWSVGRPLSVSLPEGQGAGKLKNEWPTTTQFPVMAHWLIILLSHCRARKSVELELDWLIILLFHCRARTSVELEPGWFTMLNFYRTAGTILVHNPQFVL